MIVTQKICFDIPYDLRKIISIKEHDKKKEIKNQSQQTFNHNGSEMKIIKNGKQNIYGVFYDVVYSVHAM